MNQPKVEHPTSLGWYWHRSRDHQHFSAVFHNGVEELPPGDYWGPVYHGEIDAFALRRMRDRDLPKGLYRVVSDSAANGGMCRVLVVGQDDKARFGYAPSAVELEFDLSSDDNLYEVYGAV